MLDDEMTYFRRLIDTTYVYNDENFTSLRPSIDSITASSEIVHGFLDFEPFHDGSM